MAKPTTHRNPSMAHLRQDTAPVEAACRAIRQSTDAIMMASYNRFPKKMAWDFSLAPLNKGALFEGLFMPFFGAFAFSIAPGRLPIAAASN